MFHIAERQTIYNLAAPYFQSLSHYQLCVGSSSISSHCALQYAQILGQDVFYMSQHVSSLRPAAGIVPESYHVHSAKEIKTM